MGTWKTHPPARDHRWVLIWEQLLRHLRLKSPGAKVSGARPEVMLCTISHVLLPFWVIGLTLVITWITLRCPSWLLREVLVLEQPRGVTRTLFGPWILYIAFCQNVSVLLIVSASGGKPVRSFDLLRESIGACFFGVPTPRKGEFFGGHHGLALRSVPISSKSWSLTWLSGFPWIAQILIATAKAGSARACTRLDDCGEALSYSAWMLGRGILPPAYPSMKRVLSVLPGPCCKFFL